MSVLYDVVKHRARETQTDGGKHRALGEPADPITVKRKPGANLAKPLVDEKAKDIYKDRGKK